MNVMKFLVVHSVLHCLLLNVSKFACLIRSLC